MINFNPNLPSNDALTPAQIESRVEGRNEETRAMAQNAYKTSGVPDSAASNAAAHASIQRQTGEAKKARKDARTWWDAKKRSEDSGEDD